MLKEAQDLYDVVKKNHEEVYKSLKALKELASKLPDLKELTDIAYVFTRCEKLVHDEEADMRKARVVLEKVICQLWTTQGNAENIKTAHVTASPNIKMMVTLPKRSTDPKGFETLMTDLGVPRHLWDVSKEDHAPVQPHWPGMVDYISSLAEQGKPLPRGLDPSKMYPVHTIRYFSKREVEHTEEQDAF